MSQTTHAQPESTNEQLESTNGELDDIAIHEGQSAQGTTVSEALPVLAASPLAPATMKFLAHARALNNVGEETVVRLRPVWEKASLLRRIGAELIDRALPLPFLIPLFWPWALVVIGYDLLRDAKGASVGKRLMGLQTVTASPDPAQDGLPCTTGRSVRRNLLWCVARLCYMSGVLAPAGFACDLIDILLVGLSPGGRRLGDRLAGTRVVAAKTGGTSTWN